MPIQQRLQAALLAALAACASPSSPENLPERPFVPDRKVRPDEIVAFLNGEPLTWQAVAEKTLELNLKESVDQYVRWRIVEDRKSALAISPSPEELRRRAAVYLDQVRKTMGEERLRQQLAREGATEDAKRAQLAASPFLSQMLALDKIVRFSALGVDQFDIDRVAFQDEADARSFHQACVKNGFDRAAEGPPSGTPKFRRIPPERFPRTMPPIDPKLDPWILEALSKLEPGGFTGVEMSQANLYYVVRLRGIQKGRSLPYPEAKAEVLEGILKDPPTPQEYARWMEGEVAHCRIEYAEGASRREKPR